MFEFKVGDPVQVRKPLDIGEHPGWVPEMDVYTGEVLVIIQLCSYSDLYICRCLDSSGREIPYTFNARWLRPMNIKVTNKAFELSDVVEYNSGKYVVVGRRGESVQITPIENYRLTLRVFGTHTHRHEGTAPLICSR